MEESITELDSEIDWILGTSAPLKLAYLELLVRYVVRLRLLLPLLLLLT